MDYSKFRYIVTGYPRSGTAWISQFLSLPEKHICIHDPEKEQNEFIDSCIHMYESVGVVTSFPPITTAGKINNKFIVLIDRPFQECAHSFLCFLKDKRRDDLIQGFDASVDKVRNGLILFKEANEIGLTIKYENLFHMYELRNLWEFCLPEYSFNKFIPKINQMLGMNIQIQNLTF